jgi:hypothetical protein
VTKVLPANANIGEPLRQTDTAIDPAAEGTRPASTRLRSSSIGRRFSRFLIALCGGVAVVLVVSGFGPVRSAVQIGGDELFEVSKGLLWTKGFPLYSEVWNDQPPLHTVLLGLTFKLFGPTIHVARALAVGLGLLMFSGFFLLVRKRCGNLAAWVATVCLLMAPQALVLSVSVMLEVPAMALALCALLPLYEWTQGRRWTLLALSGGLFASALQMKLTAALTGPALAVEIMLASNGTGWFGKARESLRNMTIWGMSFVAAYIVLGVALGANFDLLWASHFSSRMGDELLETNSFAFSFGLLADHTEALWCLSAAVLLAALRNDWRRLAFPVVMLLTVSAIHLNHRPWWWYYYLHFAIPIAWLTGYAISVLLKADCIGDESGHLPFGALPSRLMAIALIGLCLFAGGTRLLSEVNGMQALQRVEANPVVAKMTEFAPRTRWVYAAGSVILPFHAGLPLIPELAVVPATRIWSGRLTDAQVLLIVKQYRPEQILISDPALGESVQSFADSDYDLAYQSGSTRLYVIKAVSQAPSRLK